uniref:Transglutaminase-like domain-containing protein n=1 Tax=Oryzias sinensis TaxID=183150 RepID=A0A8C7YEA6_9TELE
MCVFFSSCSCSQTLIFCHHEEGPAEHERPLPTAGTGPRGNTSNPGLVSSPHCLCHFIALQVMTVDMQKDQNAGSHNTVDYINTPLLVVRRGQEFAINITFNRPLAPQDDVQIEFLIGSDPTPQKRSLQIVTLGNREGGTWKGQILGVQGTVTTVGITPDTQSIVGLYRTYVAIATGSGMQRTQKDPSTDFYLLFNAWSPDDDVYYPDDAGRWEYVLNSSGHIYQGAVGSVGERYWVYGQFDKGVLDACIYIMDSCQMPIHDRGDIIKVARKASAMMNSQDDNGVLVGNWSDDFSMGTPPTAWTGSTKILQDYFGQGIPVCFAQCWVYAGVLCSFMRSLGIPCRVITNFNSAHDNTGNLKTELIFKPDGTPDRRNTRDSIWNYHCWCEAFMKRSDLPPKYTGWQVVDATPQETSDGRDLVCCQCHFHNSKQGFQVGKQDKNQIEPTVENNLSA